MLKEVKGKTITFDKPAHLLFSAFSDMRNIASNLPEDQKDKVTADADSVTVTLQGMELGIRVKNRIPFSVIELEQYGQSPFPFLIILHFDPAEGDKTDFFMEMHAELNAMMKMLVGNRLQEFIDKITDQIAVAAV